MNRTYISPEVEVLISVLEVPVLAASLEPFEIEEEEEW